MKLSYKFFGAFLLCIVLSLILMVMILRIHAEISFSKYINTQIFEQLDGLNDELVQFYTGNKGWETVKTSPALFTDAVESIVSQSQFQDGHEPHHFKGPPGPPPGHDEPHGPWPPSLDKPMFPPTFLDKRHIQDKISLFDASKDFVAGVSSKARKHDLEEIRMGDHIIGYLGLLKNKPPSKPHDIGYLKQQFNAFYIIGFCILLISGLVAFFLSRNLLNPIKQLTKGTHDLASLKFNTRISIRSRDELGQLASDFNTMAQTLEQSETSKKQWISDISHELRTPLAILQGEIEALQDGVRELSAEALDSLHKEVSHIKTIVNDLYDLSLADCGTLSFHMASVDPVSQLIFSLSHFRHRFDEEGIAVIENLSRYKGTFITGDDSRLSQMYSNLLENVLRYVEKPGTLTLSARKDENRVYLTFEDSGPGVPDQALARLFDRLYRVDPSRSRETGGCGLGLSICKSITEAMNGSIRAVNSPKGGLGIEVSFPLKPHEHLEEKP